MVSADRLKINKVDWITGAAMFFSRRFINDVGFFDQENFYVW